MNARIASSVRADNIGDVVSRIFRHIRETHRSRHWPYVADFANAANKVGETSEGRTFIEPLTEQEIIAREFAEGGPVSQGYLYGAASVHLIEEGFVTSEQIANYRQAHEAALRQLYGEHAEIMISELMARDDRARQDYPHIKAQREQMDADRRFYNTGQFINPKRFGGAA